MIDGLVQAIPGIVVVIVGWFFMCFLSGAKERIEEKTKEAGAGFVDNLSRYGSAVFRDKWQVSQFEKNVVPWILVFFHISAYSIARSWRGYCLKLGLGLRCLFYGRNRQVYFS